MSRRIMSADAINEAIHQELIKDESLHGLLHEIPPFSVQQLPRGSGPLGANWTAIPCHPVGHKMAEAIRSAICKLQEQIGLDVPFLGASATAMN